MASPLLPGVPTGCRSRLEYPRGAQKVAV
ncbi:hypothetical protein [Spongiibacter sp.]